MNKKECFAWAIIDFILSIINYYFAYIGESKIRFLNFFVGSLALVVSIYMLNEGLKKVGD